MNKSYKNCDLQARFSRNTMQLVQLVQVFRQKDVVWREGFLPLRVPVH